MDKQTDFVLRTIEERGVKFVRLWFTDVAGTLKSVAIAPAEVEGAFAEGLGFDGSAIEGLTRAYEADVLAHPDPSTFQILPWRGEICNRSKSGRLYWVQTLIAPFAGADGKIEKYVAIQSDVSDLRLAQLELRKSQALLTRTSQLAGVGGWYALAGGGGLHMTPECLQLLGVADGEIGAIDELWRCFDAGARLQVREQLRDLVARRRHDIEVVVPLRPMENTPTRWVKLVAGYDEPEPGGPARTPGRLVGAVQDYTPHMLAQQRIREEQRILHSAMDAVGEAFALFDPLYLHLDERKGTITKRQPKSAVGA